MSKKNSQLNGSANLLADAIREVVSEAIAVGTNGLREDVNNLSTDVNNLSTKVTDGIQTLDNRIGSLESSNNEVWKYVATGGNQGKIPSSVKASK